MVAEKSAPAQDVNRISLAQFEQLLADMNCLQLATHVSLLILHRHFELPVSLN